MKLNNDRERMDFVRDNNNWQVNDTGLLETRSLYVGTRTFIRTIGKVKGEYELTPKIYTVNQFEMVMDKDGCHLEYASDNDIVTAIKECK